KAKSALQSRAADSTRALSTVSRLKVERLMTLSTSAVAVCCSSDSVSSFVRACSASNRRTFSMAITAWSAKVCNSAICLSEKGRTLGGGKGTPAAGPAPPQQWRGQNCPMPEPHCHGVAVRVFIAQGREVVNMDRLAIDERATRRPAPVDCPFGKIDGDGSKMRCECELVADAQQHHRIVGFAQPRRGLHNGVEHGPQFGR